MLFLLRLMLARTLFHPLEGVTFGRWLRLLRRERFRVSPSCVPRALWVTAMSLVNSPAARAVDRRFGREIDAAHVEAPIFILGHYRSGTTYLHELMATDPRFASPSRFQTYNPSTFLATERWLGPIVEPFMLPRRVQEDEIAPLNLGGLSPYMDWCFPDSPVGYERFLTFGDASPEERAEWSAEFSRFLKMLTIRHRRPLILKSPPHTARAGLLLDLFPDARFVHIRRDPFAVFVSTIGLLKALRPVFQLRRWPREIDVDAVLKTYRVMYDSYFQDRERIPPRQLVEIAYEDLERDPIGQLRVIYDGLALPDFEAVRPAIEAYIASIAGYQKNRHPKIDDATRRRIVAAWSRTFDEWGYPR